MNSAIPEINSSLEGLIVGETAISDVDGEQGQLLYRGYPINQLTDKPLLQVVALLIWGRRLSGNEQEAFEEFMAAESMLSEQQLRQLQALPQDLHPMRMLLSLLPSLPAAGPSAFQTLCPDNELYDGLSIAAKMPSLLAAWHQLQLGNQALMQVASPNPIENFLSQFHKRAPDALAIKTLNTAQILQLEHSFNASTFASRVCASTNAPVAAVLSAATATLYGPLHGGADQAALEMAQAIGSPDKAASYVEDCLNNGIKIMGMGHREYKTLDPRAAILKPMAGALCANSKANQLFLSLTAVEDACQQHFAKNDKQIWANVEFYKGAVFHALGIPSPYFTALFTMARVFGYLAHLHEFRKNPRLIRPRARYVGDDHRVAS